MLSTAQAISVFPPMHEFAHFVPSQAALALGWEQSRQLGPHRVTFEPLTHILLHLLEPIVHRHIEAMHDLFAAAHAVPVGQHTCW